MPKGNSLDVWTILNDAFTHRPYLQSDMKEYHAFCAKKSQRLRRSLNLKNCQKGKVYEKKSLEAVNASSMNVGERRQYVELLIYSIERFWSLSNDRGLNKARRIRALRKASVLCDLLHKVFGSSALESMGNASGLKCYSDYIQCSYYLLACPEKLSSDLLIGVAHSLQALAEKSSASLTGLLTHKYNDICGIIQNVPEARMKFKDTGIKTAKATTKEVEMKDTEVSADRHQAKLEKLFAELLQLSHFRPLYLGNFKNSKDRNQYLWEARGIFVQIKKILEEIRDGVSSNVFLSNAMDLRISLILLQMEYLKALKSRHLGDLSQSKMHVDYLKSEIKDRTEDVEEHAHSLNKLGFTRAEQDAFDELCRAVSHIERQLVSAIESKDTADEDLLPSGKTLAEFKGVKPIFFDLAYDTIEYPSYSSVASNVTAGITSMFKKLWGGQ